MRVGRSDHPTLWGGIATGLIAAAALLAIATQAEAATPMDYGDAPDGAGAGYSIAVTGEFPSLLASSGPRHRSSGPSLGVGRDKEADSKQVDRDRFDDGVSLERLGRCKTSVLTVLIDTRRIPERLLRKRDLYLNSWFDWDRSGVWGETNGCPNAEPLRNNEWAIVNQRISGKAFLKERVRAFSIKFKAGLHSREFWTRVTLTLGQKLPIDPASRSGGASGSPYAYGETEDYLIRSGFGPPPEFPDRSGKGKKKEKKKEKKEREEREEKELEEKPFKVSCIPNPAIVAHGKAVKVRFSVVDEGKGPIFGRTLSRKSTPDYRTRVLRHSNQKGVPNGYFRAAGFSFRSKKRDARANPVEREVIRFSFVRGKVKQLLKCAVTVIHEKIVKPKKPHKPPPVQPLVPPPGPQPQPGPGGGQSGGEQQPLQAKGTYAQEGPQQYKMEAAFNQSVDGFRIRLTGASSPTIDKVVTQMGFGIECVVDGQSVLCTGSVEANLLALCSVQFDAPVEPTELEGRLELYGIQGGVEKGPFQMQAGSPVIIT